MQLTPHELPNAPTVERRRPRNVEVAVWALTASVLLGMTKVALMGLPGPIWIAAVVVIVMLGLAFAIWAGKNWARIVTLVFFVLGLPAIFSLRESLAHEGAASIATLLLQTVLQAGALVCLFTGQAREWFRHRSSHLTL